MTLDALADAICIAAPTIDRASAMHWLLHSAHGRALSRMNKNEDDQMMPFAEFTKAGRDEQLADLAKRGAPALAKAIVDGGIPGLTETEFTKIVHDHAQSSRGADESPAQAFTRFFSANTDEGRTIRKAHALTKRFPNTMITKPVQVGGAAATAVDDPTDALAQLQSLAEEQRKLSPTLTIEQAFACVYAATENVELVNRERLQNRPRATTIYPGA